LRLEDASHRPLQPTFDTSTQQSFDSRARSFRAATPSVMRPEREPHAIRTAASDHLAAIRPRVEQRLTAPLQLRTNNLRPSIHLSRRKRAPPESGAALPRRSQPRTGPVIRPLTPPVALCIRLLPDVHRAPESLPPPSRQRERLSRPEAPFIDKCSLDSACAEGARHRTHGFATVGRLPTLFRSS